MILRRVPIKPSDQGRPSERRQPGDRGLMTTELAILMPVMFLIALVAVFAVDVERHGSRAQQAADAGARAASLERTEGDARAAAESAAAMVCEGPVTIDRFEFEPPDEGTFTPGVTTVQLTCSEPFSGFEPLIDDRTRSESGVAVAVIEYWRTSP